MLSMPSNVTLIMMVGGTDASPVERMVTEACRMATADTIERTRESGAFQRWIVATNSDEFGSWLRALFPFVEVSLDAPGFHFGRRLRDLIACEEVAVPFYCGGGSGVLLDPGTLGRIARTVSSEPETLLTNNCYSSDLCAFNPGDAIQRIKLPDSDNDLAWRLATKAGLRALTLTRGAEALMDIDTPSDLLTLLPHPGVGHRLRSHLEGLRLNRAALDGVLSVLRKPGSRVSLAGRVGAGVCRYLEDRTGCRLAVYSEERGLRASGRHDRGEARSILTFLADRNGWRDVFAHIADGAECFIFDTRVALAHKGPWPPAADRFWSDLLEPGCVRDPFLRELTAAATEAPIPVLLGGHSIVSGGLYALVDAAVPHVRPAQSALQTPQVP